MRVIMRLHKRISVMHIINAIIIFQEDALFSLSIIPIVNETHIMMMTV